MRQESTPFGVMNVATFERFFRRVANLDVDKNDLKRFNEFVSQKIYDLLVRAEAIAKANGRDVIQPYDLPIPKGLQQRIQEFTGLDEIIEMRTILEDIATRPQLDLSTSSDTDAELPRVAGGLSVALAHTFKIIDPTLKNPQTEHWERSFRLFDLLL
ncbi:MAG: hypothetical protein KatS3mg059_0677 [Thermomicrobiales bacterium]|nr:MAG: hypothetical protein KatS3mg059_0677 [Thermomicrobiales bacterium]